MGADGATKKTSQLEFMKGLFAQLPAAVKTGVADFSEAESASLDTAEGITKAATAYQFSQKQQGFDVSIIDAVAHVTKKGQ
jgi:glycerol-3-phosphate dehydrogenase